MPIIRITGTGAAGAYQQGDKFGFQTAEKIRRNLNLLEDRVGRFTVPVNADFAWVNQGSSSVAEDADRETIVLTGAATAVGANIVGRVKTAPATPYVITAFFDAMLLPKAFNGFGLGFRDSAGGGIHLSAVFGSAGSTDYTHRSTKYTSPTAFSADYQAIVLTDAPRWHRIADDGTNRICSLSVDGVNWLQVHSVARTDFLTANQVGFFVSTENSAVPNFAPIVTLRSWLQS